MSTVQMERREFLKIFSCGQRRFADWFVSSWRG